MSSAIEIFEEMIDRIGMEAALQLQLSVALKIRSSVQSGQNAMLTPQECAFMAIWIDSLVELKVGHLVDTEDEVNPAEVGKPG